ncbi:flippase-like domain-containing protein [Candidatus Micrarchaeota archaeon]|nr:flippase-like domain-containing protein [Candidatus Micrarchaeota archaeon]
MDIKSQLSRHKYLINIIGSLVIFGLLFYFFDIGKVLEVLSKSNLLFILIAVFFYILVNLAMSYRIQLVLKKLSMDLKLRQILNSNFAGMLASDFTPARAGYFFTAFSLSSRFKLPIEKTILSIFGPQLFDFTIKISSVAILMLFMVSALKVANMDSGLITLSILIMFATIAFFGLLLVYPPLLEKFSFIKKLKIGRKAFYLFHLMQLNSKSLLEIKWQIVGVTLLSWFFKGIEWYFLAKAVGISILDDGLYMVLFMMIFQGAVTLIHFLPIPTIAGGGTSEAAFTGLLVLLGVKPEIGLAFALLTRGIMILIDSVGIPTIIEYIRKDGFSGLLKELDSMESKAQGG